ncbi:hypothetical protein [Spiroplasma cantharicola]|uniref:Uncharacterized protein n=1 Tax=Spiroplasma cantharicola TaxID=362837 RepID=A0A0M4KES3_9MOLU|nr:hypothetical protein [Spiroplasma cantharicola]ALD66545.1 hypothetical protein SCANT_v1c06390 [Spiroplasma cantharicola]
MRIIPYEIYKYAPDITLTALRKEFGMHDYCLNLKPNNKAMQPFLDLGRNYFNLLIFNWKNEMDKRGYYVNSFHSFYSLNNSFHQVETDYFLILECIIQWELKDFLPYNTKLTWYKISQIYLENSSLKLKSFTIKDYNSLLKWYKQNFMVLNQANKWKPKNLDINKVTQYFKNYFDNN